MKKKCKKKKSDAFVEFEKMIRNRMELVLSLIPNAVRHTYGYYMEFDIDNEKTIF